MYTRRLALPSRSFLLLGPRGTGKTTWLRRHLPRAQWYNLLLDRELLRLMREPGAFRREIEALPKGAWVVVDEVQKLSALLNEVHDALSAAPRRWNFALTAWTVEVKMRSTLSCTSSAARPGSASALPSA